MFAQLQLVALEGGGRLTQGPRAIRQVLGVAQTGERLHRLQPQHRVRAWIGHRRRPPSCTLMQIPKSAKWEATDLGCAVSVQLHGWASSRGGGGAPVACTAVLVPSSPRLWPLSLCQ